MSTIEKKPPSTNQQRVNRKAFHPIYKQIEQALNTKNPPYTVSLSGGIDSTALLYMMANMYPVEQLKILYVNHNLRPNKELQKEMSLIQYHGETLGIPVCIQTVEEGAISTLCEANTLSPEEGARVVRYEIFQNHIQTYGGCILLGHTEDDQIETLIHRFFQGAGVDGLCGIAEEREYIVRPLLSVQKVELEQFLRSHNISWSEDSTNREDLYLRNLMRHHLMPQLDTIFPGYQKALLQGRRKMIDLREEVLLHEELFPQIEELEGGGVTVQLSAFSNLTRWGKFRMLCAMWNHQKSLGKGELSYQSTLPILHNDFSQDGMLYGAQGTLWEWKKGLLFLSKLVAPSVKKGYFNIVQTRRTSLFDQYYLELYSGSPEKGEIWLPTSVASEPLVVRSYLSGDTIDLIGGNKRIKELYNQWSVPIDRRWEIPLLVDSRGVIGVFGKPFGYVNRVSKRMVNDEKHPIVAVVRKE